LRGLYPGDFDVYVRMVRGKTAALFSAACRAGAQLADACAETAEALTRFGDLLGIAFQMADDLLDYSESSGKPRGQDIRERVLSLPLIYATEDMDVGARVRELLSGTPSEDDIEQIQELVTASGALERVRDDLHHRVDELRRADETARDAYREARAEEERLRHEEALREAQRPRPSRVWPHAGASTLKPRAGATRVAWTTPHGW